MSHHEAIFRFSTSRAKQIHLALAPELSGEVNTRSITRCWVEDDDFLVMRVKADDIAALRAALNMFLRLINVADEMQDLKDLPVKR